LTYRALQDIIIERRNNMENLRIKSQKVIDEISKTGYESSIHILEQEFKKLLEQERDEVVKEITSKAWSFNKIPIKMYFHSIYSLVFKPKYFYYIYFKGIQNMMARHVKERNYN
jgi:hypothetical protein